MCTMIASRIAVNGGGKGARGWFPVREAIVVGEIDLGRIEEVRRGWPFLRDRRVDAYAGISSRFLDAHP